MRFTFQTMCWSLFLLCPIAMSAGGVVSGGGFAVMTRQNFQLLDLQLHKPSLLQGCRSGEIQWEIGQNLRYSSFPLAQDIESDILFWRSTKSEFVDKFHAALAKLEFSFQNSSLGFIKEKFVAPESWRDSIRPVARYKNSRVKIFLPVFNVMCKKSQLGLIYHEVFRQIQIDYRGNFDTEELQKLSVAFLSRKDPENLLSLKKIAKVTWTKPSGPVTKLLTGRETDDDSREVQLSALNARLRANPSDPMEQFRLDAVRVRVCYQSLTSLRRRVSYGKERAYFPPSAIMDFEHPLTSVEVEISSLLDCYRSYGYPVFDKNFVVRETKRKLSYVSGNPGSPFAIRYFEFLNVIKEARFSYR